jgi:hypothetical protein
MVATDVASRGIGMIKCCPLPRWPIPPHSYLYLLPYRRRVTIGALLSPFVVYVFMHCSSRLRMVLTLGNLGLLLGFAMVRSLHSTWSRLFSTFPSCIQGFPRDCRHAPIQDIRTFT